MKLWMENLADEATPTAATANAEFPVTNVRTPRLTQVYKTTGAGVGEYVVFDFGSPVEPDALIIAAHNLTADSGLATFLLLGGSSAAPLPTDLIYTLTAAAGTIAFDIAAATPLSGTPGAYRYWAVQFNKNTAADIKSIGRIYLGPEIAVGDLGLPDYDGVTETTRDRSEADESIAGEEYIEEKSQVRSWALDFTEIPEDEMADIVERYQDLGKAHPFFMQISDVTPLDETIYVRFTNDLGRKVGSFDGSFNWNTALAIKEFI
jgi:hypothetical protein